MDQQQFDALARAFAIGSTRRVVLKGTALFAGLSLSGLPFLRPASLTNAQDGGAEATGVAGCEPAECPPGQVQSLDTCSCECPAIDCLPNYYLNPVTCQCYCSLSDSYVCPNPAQVYDNCACECANDECPGDALLDPDSCECYCPDNIACSPGEAPDPVTCECVCVLQCEGNQLLGERDCECYCENDDCDDPYILDDVACTCVCPPYFDCASPFVADRDACACVCSPEITCGDLFVLDPHICECVCAELVPCSDIHKLDPVTCKCLCRDESACPEPKVRDEESCECVCAPAISCPDGNPPNKETCLCGCESGQVKCGEKCVERCKPTEKLNAECECEEIVCPPERGLVCECGCPSGFSFYRDECVPACGPNQVLDYNCQCVCTPNIPCPVNKPLDPKSCSCVCDPIRCISEQTWDKESCKCVCKQVITCADGKIFSNETCGCVCPEAIACPEHQSINPATCTCTCGDVVCPTLKVVDQATCGCVCRTDRTCPGAAVINPKTCGCECKEKLACQKGEVFDTKACACVCTPGALLDTVIVPVAYFYQQTQITLRNGVHYRLRASGTFKAGPAPLDGGDAEYTFSTASPTDLTKVINKCGGVGNENDVGISINNPSYGPTKQPYWGPYNPTHIYEADWVGQDSPVNFMYKDCPPSESNVGELKVEIFCPSPIGDPVSTGGTSTPCIQECPPNKIPNNVCGCRCKPEIICSGGQILDPEACTCGCLLTATCGPGEVLDQTTCTCLCPPGNVIETIEVPCSGATVLSTTSLDIGVTYQLRAKGVCTIGFVRPYKDDVDAEYAFEPSDPTNLSLTRDRCPGQSNIQLGIGIDDSKVDGAKTPSWGAYSPAHEYTIDFAGKGAPISLNFHDCVYSDNKGSMTVEILCPKAVG